MKQKLEQVQFINKFLNAVICLLVALLMVFLLVAFFSPQAKAQDVGVGDSIMVGTGHALGIPTYAKKSMGSCWIKNHVPLGHFDHAAISAGINDAPGPCLVQIRQKLNARIVTWILPAPINSARAHVIAVSQQWGDRTVSYSCLGGCTKSNFHPASYAEVANAVRSTWK